MSIDYIAVLEDLAEKRAAAVGVFDGVMDGLRLLVGSGANGGQMPPRKLIAPAPKRAQRVAAKVHRTAADAHALKARRTARITIQPQVKAMVAKVGISEAARYHGINIKTLWGRAKREGWKVAKAHMGRPCAAAPKLTTPAKASAKKPLGEKVPMRRCESCQMMTTRNPCEFCGTARKALEA